MYPNAYVDQQITTNRPNNYLTVYQLIQAIYIYIYVYDSLT